MLVDEKLLLVEYIGLTPSAEGEYCLPEFGITTSSGEVKDLFTLAELKFHEDWNWVIYAVRQATKEVKGFQFTIDKCEQPIDIFKKLINMIKTLKHYEETLFVY